MIYARVVVFSFLFVALYILPFVLFYLLLFFVFVLLCMCLCICVIVSFFFLPPFSYVLCAVSWLAARSLGWIGSDRSFDRLIDSSVGGSRVTLSSFLLYSPHVVLHLNYLCILYSQSVSRHIWNFWTIFLSFWFIYLFFLSSFAKISLPLSLISSRSRFAQDCPLVLDIFEISSENKYFIYLFIFWFLNFVLFSLAATATSSLHSNIEHPTSLSSPMSFLWWSNILAIFIIHFCIQRV